jgi:hypothetical protein
MYFPAGCWRVREGICPLSLSFSKTYLNHFYPKIYTQVIHIYGPDPISEGETLSSYETCQDAERQIQFLKPASEQLCRSLDSLTAMHQKQALSEGFPIKHDKPRLCQFTDDHLYQRLIGIGTAGLDPTIADISGTLDTPEDRRSRQLYNAYREELSAFCTSDPFLATTTELEAEYRRLLSCTLLVSPFVQEPDKDKLILYLVADDLDTLAMTHADFRNDTYFDIFVSDIPKEKAFTPSTFRRMEEETDENTNTYIAHNPSRLVTAKVLCDHIIDRLRKAYMVREPRVINSVHGGSIVIRHDRHYGIAPDNRFHPELAELLMIRHCALMQEDDVLN